MKTSKWVDKIADCIEKNFSFSVPDEDGTKYLCGNKDAWDKLREIVVQIKLEGK